MYTHILMLLILAAMLLAACTPQKMAAQIDPPPTSAALPTATITATGRLTAGLTATATPTILPSPTMKPTITATAAAAAAAATRLPLPASAEVKGMFGFGQLLPLSCEARAAADWARHFDIRIAEMDFVKKMPFSDNPEEGFVGSLYAAWGSIPPEASPTNRIGYGVHAAPVAKLLQTYGAKAEAVREYTLDQLKSEIAAGRPVIVWVVGHVEIGKGVEYKVEGQIVTVARFEHTVIAIGYDEKNIKILDGKTIYSRPTTTFAKSWGALKNMAIVWKAD